MASRRHLERKPRSSGEDFDAVKMANGFQRLVLRFLRRAGLDSWACRRAVVADGGCFFDSVLANAEDKPIGETLPDRFWKLQAAVANDADVAMMLQSLGLELDEVRCLRIALAKFMSSDETLQELEWFKLYKNFTMEEAVNKGRTWDEYLFAVGYTNQYADQLQIMCMALLCGKTIAQTCPDYPLSDPWVKVPGEVDGWPHKATKPDITLFYTGLSNVQHFEPIVEIGKGARTIQAEAEAPSEMEKNASLRGQYATYKRRYVEWEGHFKRVKGRAPNVTDMPGNIASMMQKCQRIEALLKKKERQSPLKDSPKKYLVAEERLEEDYLDYWALPVEDYDEDEDMEEDNEEDAANEDHMESSNNNDEQETPMVTSTSDEITEIPTNEVASSEKTVTSTVEVAKESPSKSAEDERKDKMRKSFLEFYAKIVAWEEEFVRANGRKPQIYERTPEIKKCHRNCEYIQSMVTIELPKAEQNKPVDDDKTTDGGVGGEEEEELEDFSLPYDPHRRNHWKMKPVPGKEKGTTEAKEDTEKDQAAKPKKKLSDLRMFRRQSRRPGGSGLGLRM